MADDIIIPKEELRRSTSMPVKPRYCEPDTLKRSDEKEILYADDEDDHYNSQDSDTFLGQVNKFKSDRWLGSTIDLNIDLKKNVSELDCIKYNKRTCRVVEQNGNENVQFLRIPDKSWRYWKDFVTTLIELEWKYTLSLFVGSFFTSWFVFAVLWYMVAYAHGDMLFDEVTGERLGEGKEPCVIGASTFVGMLLHSIETQTTVGFGERYPSEECPESMFLFIMQIIVSVGIEGAMVSIIYAKTARPTKQLAKMRFSNKAVVCYRDGKLCLIFRICDPRKQQIIGTKIRAYVLKDRVTSEGELIKTHTELKIENNGNSMIMWPETICHIIDKNSPFYNYKTAKDFNIGSFEIFVSIVGSSPATGQMTEERTSYLSKEVFWGQRFVNVIVYDPRNDRYIIDYSNFNTTISVDMHGKSIEIAND
ncbi:ATP-sensitive inward rectifier potassium channel 11-like isoform X1 [Episyrphus balteatus]|uniref:ATP-sensitive inward rectifier potassium channel 11-like isoform X1 n=1 Tax=Episyrphus balteatus TaxID=286459 RepID=UPI00248501D0|nr:ATP-sensitive inward rectifier potassium channel 11-like isoform X1 [Episyrphus balteatus]